MKGAGSSPAFSRIGAGWDRMHRWERRAAKLGKVVSRNSVINSLDSGRDSRRVVEKERDCATWESNEFDDVDLVLAPNPHRYMQSRTQEAP